MDSAQNREALSSVLNRSSEVALNAASYVVDVVVSVTALTLIGTACAAVIVVGAWKDYWRRG
jgi:hypothetical protein